MSVNHNVVRGRREQTSRHAIQASKMTATPLGTFRLPLHPRLIQRQHHKYHTEHTHHSDVLWYPSTRWDATSTLRNGHHTNYHVFTYQGAWARLCKMYRKPLHPFVLLYRLHHKNPLNNETIKRSLMRCCKRVRSTHQMASPARDG